MPYVRSRKTYKRKRGRRSTKSTGAKRRKISTVRRSPYRRKLVSKRLGTKWVSRARRGVGATLGNKYIHAQTVGTLIWHQPNISAQTIAPGQYYGRVILMNNFISLTGVLGGARQFVTPENVDVYTPDQMNKFAARFQCSKVLYAKVVFDFYIEDDQQFLANSDEAICGIYLSDRLIPPPLTSLCDWDSLRRAGNMKWKKYNKHAGKSMKIEMDVNVPACVGALAEEDKWCVTWPQERIDDAKKIDDLYPNEPNLYAYGFWVPLTRTLQEGSPMNMCYRAHCVKKVLYRRPIQNILQVDGLDQYPPFRAALPVTYAPRPLYPVNQLDAALQELQTNVDDLQSQMAIDDLEDSSVQSATNFNTAQVNNLTTQVNTVIDDLGTVQAQADQNTIQITSLSSEFDDHVALPANQAHG